MQHSGGQTERGTSCRCHSDGTLFATKKSHSHNFNFVFNFVCNFVFATNTHSQACHIITKCTAQHADRREGDLRHQQRVLTSPVATAAAVEKRRSPASTPTFALPLWQPARCAKHPSPRIQPLAEAQTQQTQNNQPPNRALAQFQTQETLHRRQMTATADTRHNPCPIKHNSGRSNNGRLESVAAPTGETACGQPPAGGPSLPLPAAADAAASR